MIVLTKADLATTLRRPPWPRSRRSPAACPCTRSRASPGAGLDALVALLGAWALTAALLGSSGVGKSTLVNTLAGEELLATQEIRDDGKGRHTTTRRELVQLPGGALVIDTPGMRELSSGSPTTGSTRRSRTSASSSVGAASPIAPTSTEPGCAVRAALEDGHARPEERWESYLKLQRELAHLERRLDKRAASEAKKRWKSLSVFAREAGRAKGRR